MIVDVRWDGACSESTRAESAFGLGCVLGTVDRVGSRDAQWPDQNNLIVDARWAGACSESTRADSAFGLGMSSRQSRQSRFKGCPMVGSKK